MSYINKSILIVLLSILLLSCKSNTIAQTFNLDKSVDTSINILIITNAEKSSLELTYRNKFNDNEVLYANTINDTIKIASTEFIPLRIKYAAKNIMFPLLKGDSLEIKSIVDHEWQFHNLNSKKKQFDTLFLKYSSQRLQFEYDKLRKILLSNSSAPINNLKAFAVKTSSINTDKYYREFYEQTTKINQLEWQLLDSLKKEGKISETYINVYGSLINAGYVNNIIECYKQTKSSKFLNMIVQNDKYLKKEYLGYDAGQFKDMLNNYMEQLIAKGKFHKYGQNAITIDYKGVFDSSNLYFNNQLLDYIRFICLKNIKQQFPSSEFQDYFSRFKTDTHDSSYIDYFLQNFENNANSGIADSNLLYDITKSKSISLDSIIYTNKNNILYLDLWASWCTPCRAAMPASKKLNVDYAGKGIKFIYLSLDDNFTSWKNAVVQENLNPYNESYLFVNPKKAAFLKKLKVASIPRYIIINRKGSIINSNAPSPDSKEIRNILNQLL